MSDDKFDAIIVGGGMAGLSSAIVLANAGMEVLLCERGDTCGSKNMTGGRLYGHSLEKVIPGFAEEAPIERRITKEMVSLMSEQSAVNINFGSTKLSAEADNASYTVLRKKFDRWMAEKAEEAGAILVPQIRVDKVLTDDDGKVVGIDAAGEEMYSDVVILADGVNSLLAQQLGMKAELKPNEVAVGAKEVLELDEETINQRFGLRGDEVCVDLHQPLQLDGIVDDLERFVRAGEFDELIVASADKDLSKVPGAVQKAQKGRQFGFCG